MGCLWGWGRQAEPLSKIPPQDKRPQESRLQTCGVSQIFLQTVFLWNKDTCPIMTFFSCPFSSDLQKLAGRKGSLVNTEGLKGKLFNNSSKMQAIFDIWVNVHYTPCAFQMCAVPPRTKTHTHSPRLRMPLTLLTVPMEQQAPDRLINSCPKRRAAHSGGAAGILQNTSTK